jgi:hypothetical protein
MNKKKKTKNKLGIEVHVSNPSNLGKKRKQIAVQDQPAPKHKTLFEK